MAMKTAPKRKLVSMDAPSREAVRKGNDNDAAGKTGLLENGVDSKIMDICIDDIRLNPDNAIFVENDTEEDINNLAYDIEKNGLLHNLVVFEVMEKMPRVGEKSEPTCSFPANADIRPSRSCMKEESLPIKQLRAAVLSQRG